jgi:hypothetical protein
MWKWALLSQMIVVWQSLSSKTNKLNGKENINNLFLYYHMRTNDLNDSGFKTSNTFLQIWQFFHLGTKKEKKK